MDDNIKSKTKTKSKSGGKRDKSTGSEKKKETEKKGKTVKTSTAKNNTCVIHHSVKMFISISFTIKIYSSHQI